MSVLPPRGFCRTLFFLLISVQLTITVPFFHFQSFFFLAKLVLKCNIKHYNMCNVWYYILRRKQKLTSRTSFLSWTTAELQGSTLTETSSSPTYGTSWGERRHTQVLKRLLSSVSLCKNVSQQEFRASSLPLQVLPVGPWSSPHSVRTRAEAFGRAGRAAAGVPGVFQSGPGTWPGSESRR